MARSAARSRCDDPGNRKTPCGPAQRSVNHARGALAERAVGA